MSTSQSYATNNGRANSSVALSATHQAISLDSPPTVRQYFEKVRELAKSGIQFPVQLSEVWHLIYTRKGDAVRALTNDFEEGFDYQSLRKSAKREIGATTSNDYSLTVSCMEFFIARKVRAIFDVYREVFHWVADIAEQSTQQLGLVTLVNGLTGKMVNLEDKLDRLAKSRQRYYKAFVVEKEKSNKAKKDTTQREEIFDLWDRYIKMPSFENPYGMMEELHEKLRQYFDIDLRKMKREPGEHYFDAAISNGRGYCVVEVLKYHMHRSHCLK